jgi:ribosomal protein S13
MANAFVIYRAVKQRAFSGIRLDHGLHCNGQGRQDDLKLYRKGVEL